MHPALDISNLQRLPAHQRAAAIAVSSDNPTVGQLQAVKSHVETAATSRKKLYLPVFYSHLAREHIPTPKDWESHSTAILDCLSRATLSLQCIFKLLDAAESDLLFAVWPCIWPWIYFLHVHAEHIPATIRIPETILYTSAVIIAAHTRPTMELSSTLGFRNFLGKAWAVVLASDSTPSPSTDKPFDFDRFFVSLARFLGNLRFDNPNHFAELLSGAGGTLEHLANLSGRYLRNVIEHSPPQSIPPIHLPSIIAFVLSSPSGVANVPRNKMQEQFLDILPRHGFIHALILALDAHFRWEVRSDSHSFPGAVLLKRLFMSPHGSGCLFLAIEIGLLRVLGQIALRHSPAIDVVLQYFLDTILPGGLANYDVVHAFDTMRAELGKLSSSRKFRALSIYPKWEFCMQLGEMRCRLLRQMEDKEEFRACDDLKCGKIQLKSNLRRCSGCHTAYYCARECQVSDWEHGNHNKWCYASQKLSLAESVSDPIDLGYHERRFLRILVHQTYQENIQFICVEQVKLLASVLSDSGSESESPVVLFDFTANPPYVSVLPISHCYSVLPDEVHSQLGYLSQRERQSRGRMQLHIVKLMSLEDRTKGEVRFWVIPLRSDSGFVWDELERVASKKREDGDAIEGDVEGIIEKVLSRRGGNVVDIH
ncbi:hypothetical protein R3P38DRAFT_3253190 [Favolaschia claudopus]|uniref:MYND-type domain-containing protein n=1 Tax=Favolaschia claudopus TaxID=2862362 RepID=A0AAW0E363_9AGAR